VRITRPRSLGTAGDSHHLHLSSLEVLDQTNVKLPLAYTGCASEYVKRGHYVPPQPGFRVEPYTPADVIDGNPQTSSQSDWSANAVYGSQDHWMEFEVPWITGGDTTIVVVNTQSNPTRLSGATLAVLDFDGTAMAEFTLTADIDQRFQLHYPY